MFLLLAVHGFFLLISSAFAQKKVTTSDQVWIQSYHEGQISEKWTVLLDGGFRWRDGFADKSSYIIRGGMGYSLSPKMRIAAGFANLGFYALEKIVRREYRPYQDVSYKSAWGKVNINNRLRIEERFFTDNLVNAATVDFNFRFRYNLTFGIPVASLSAKDPNRKLILNVGDEIFLNAGKQISHRIFDQNRLIISPTLQWNKDLNISLTYNHQLASSPNPDIFLKSRVIWLQIRHGIDLGNYPDKK